MNAAQWQTMVHWLPEEVWNAGGVQVAVKDDVNGFPRAGAKALLDRGIHRLFTGINEDNGGVPFRPPSAFWCQQPDVNRLQAMVFNNFWYTNFVADSHGVMEFQFDLVWSPRPQTVAPAAAAALVSKPSVLSNPGPPEEPQLSRSLFQL